MKKLLALMLAAVMALSLVACGGGGDNTGDNNTPSTGNGDETSTNTPSDGGEDSISNIGTELTYEELLENSTMMSGSELENATTNKVKMQQFVGNNYIIPGKVWSVEENYCAIQPVFSGGYEWGNFLYLNVYLPVEVLAELTYGQEIAVVGTITETKSEDMAFEGTTLPVNTLIMKGAYQCTEADRLKYALGYDTSPEAVMEMALIFGNDGDNNISWKENSFPYFIAVQHMFSLLDDEQIKETIVGNWITTDRVDDAGDTREWIFYDDGTGIRQKHKNDVEENYEVFYWSVENGLNIGYSPNEVRITWTMYQASDDVLLNYDAEGRPMMVFIKG